MTVFVYTEASGVGNTADVEPLSFDFYRIITAVQNGYAIGTKHLKNRVDFIAPVFMIAGHIIAGISMCNAF